VFTKNLTNLPGTPFSLQNLYNLLSGLACYLIRFAIIFTAIMFIIYGISFLSSRGSSQGMISAKTALTRGIIGALVVFGVFTIILTVANIVGVNYPILNMISCG
jgi:hypothetical protein